ncbi:MAG TPA: PKD domain-containing protein [Anaerolineae bacterium]|nr:PKD domain-containing protein [Anaerolineae bacterium]
MTFTNQSTPTDTITSYLWDFGDGVTSPITNPVHIYTATGVYTVALAAFTASQQDTLTRTSYITVASGARVTSVVTIDYAYDPLYRLTSAEYMGAYTHSVAYTYDAADRLTSVGGVPYTYDANPTPLRYGDYAATSCPMARGPSPTTRPTG